MNWTRSDPHPLHTVVLLRSMVTLVSSLAFLPSPPFKALHLGPFQLRAYGLMIALGVIAAWCLADRRWTAVGGSPGDIEHIALRAVPAGLVGARIYHVITSYEGYIDRPWRALKIWDGGLGIPGGIAAGVLCGIIVARRRSMSLAPLLDAVAPAIALAQAIGRWGNWFNQELFGRPTSLPWGLRIDRVNRPAEFASSTTFQPTFLYESLWNLALVAALLVAERRLHLRPGRLFALYLAGYASGRLWIEGLRIDAAHSVAGLRVNEWVSVVALATVGMYLVVDAFRQRAKSTVSRDGKIHPRQLGSVRDEPPSSDAGDGRRRTGRPGE
jgi:prolipoprotein diacylglyceryl transferase